jgi:hypothetical protein
MIVAASRWMAISPTLLETSSPAAAGARQDSAVSVTAIWMNRRSAPANVNCANAASGILPPAARCRPAAPMLAAASVVAAAATAATKTVVRLNDEAAALALRRSTFVVPFGDGRRRMRRLISSTNERSPKSTALRQTSARLVSSAADRTALHSPRIAAQPGTRARRLWWRVRVCGGSRRRCGLLMTVGARARV